MNTNSLSLIFADSVESAPTYTSEVTALSIDHCVIVRGGTDKGSPTVDLVFTDDQGNRYLTMTTGKLLAALVAAIGPIPD